MRASIIITGDKKENFLKDTIESCLKQNCRDFEIILVYNKLHNFKHLKEIFKNKIIFKKIKKKIKNPVRDQLYKIYEGLKTAKGKYIFLLDGDDIFKKNKLISILNIKKKNCLFLDDHLILKRGKYIYKNNKFYKKYLIYKLLFNSWPDKICTSCISGQKELFTKFYESIKIQKIKFLAIDILLTIFYIEKLYKVSKILTVKKIVQDSVDNNYLYLFSKIYWQRRIEQHKFFKNFKKKKYTLEYYFCILMTYIF